MRARAELETLESDPEMVLQAIEERLGVPISLVSSGPRSTDVSERRRVGCPTWSDSLAGV